MEIENQLWAHPIYPILTVLLFDLLRFFYIYDLNYYILMSYITRVYIGLLKTKK